MSDEVVAGEFSGIKMLLAEDININREIFISFLRETGIEIDCAVNGQEALGMIEANPDKYSVVFMDVYMPKMDGLEATRRIRKLPNDIPIIAMTANINDSDKEKCFLAGMDDHLGKPLDIDKVLKALRKYIA